MYIYIYVYMSIIAILIYIYIHTYICIYIYMCYGFTNKCWTIWVVDIFCQCTGTATQDAEPRPGGGGCETIGCLDHASQRERILDEVWFRKIFGGWINIKVVVFILYYRYIYIDTYTYNYIKGERYRHIS